MAHLLRKKSQYVIAFGACAQTGGIPGLANLYTREEIFRTVYLESVSTTNARGPSLRRLIVRTASR
jgi:F420-non-reducing hydrogenase small subunit